MKILNTLGAPSNRMWSQKLVARTGALVGAGLLMIGSAVAQDPVQVTLNDVTVANDGMAEIEFSVTGNGESRGLQVRFDYDNAGIDGAADLSDCLDGFIGSEELGTDCAHPGGDESRVRVLLNAGAGNAINDFTGVIRVQLNGTLAEDDVVDLVWDEAFGAATNPDAEVSHTDGSITILGAPPEEVSELSVSPASVAFGTVDLGNMPVTETITAENTGGADSSLTINDAPYSGDGEFSIITDGCTGTTLAQNETCDVVVEFDAGGNGSFTGAVAFDSDADTNPTANVEVSGSADSVADLSVDPAFGSVNLGQDLPGSTVSANGSVTNNGSADGDFSCNLSGDPEITTDPDLSSAITVAAGDSVDFGISCDLPQDGVEGDSFNATLECSGDNGFGGTHDISCGVTERQPLAVPTMSKIGLGVLALLMVMIGGLTVRFFRT